MPIFSFTGYALTELFGKHDNNDKFINKRARLFKHKTCLKRGEKKKLLGRHNKDISLKTFAK